jgi:hypothetical protein
MRGADNMRAWILILGAAALCRAQGVEFIGLEESTQKAAEDKLERLPDGRIHYCAADLIKGGFANASVIAYAGGDRKLFTVVTVVEGKRAADVRRRDLPSREIQAPAQWTATSAIDVLLSAKDFKARMAAAKALREFGGRDETWRALAAGMRDGDDRVAGECTQSLFWLRKHEARKIDWGAAQADLAALLRGANLFGFTEIIETLTASQIERNMAAPLLGNGAARLLLANLRAHHDVEHNAAHALLVQLRGADLGVRAEAWEAWVAEL